jgi:hypothetical protein
VNRQISFAELCERARLYCKKNSEAESAPGEKKKKGLEFMALRMNVALKHLELAVTKKITPSEDNLIKILELRTIGAFKSDTEFHISELSALLGYKEKAKIWRILKSLSDKKYIIRTKTHSKDIEILGLNPEIFDQILINKQHEKEKIKRLKIAVDNTKKVCG